MKQIGYIHRYSAHEQKGILVYGYSEGFIWKMPSLVLFSRAQCLTSLKSNSLVYFEIEDNVVSHIEPASIFNFDRKLIVSIVSVFETKNWYECDKCAYIRYPNINEMTECIEYEKTTSGTQHSDSKFRIEDGVTFDTSDILLYDEDSLSEEYKKITLPSSIEEEFALLSKHLGETLTTSYSKNSSKKHFVDIDILEPNFWIPKIQKSRKVYYGKDGNECIDLFNLLVGKRRKAYDEDLSRARFGSRDNLSELNVSRQRALHPELFQNDCVSSNWTYLLNQLPDEEIKRVYSKYAILQPVLPESFCKKHIMALNEEYGFPSIYIAALFLETKVKNAVTATDYLLCESLLDTVMNCGAKHLPGEGVPLCAIGKERLAELSLFLRQQRGYTINYIKKQICNANPTFKYNLSLYVNEQNINTMLHVGKLYDIINRWLLSESENQAYRRSQSILASYKELPSQICILFDSYLHRILEEKIIGWLRDNKLSPFVLNSMLESFSKWITPSFQVDNSRLIDLAFSEISNWSDLRDALEYGYISDNSFLVILRRLSKSFSVQNLVQFITEPNEETGYICFEDIPIDAQKYILNRIVELYDAKTFGSYECIRVSEFNDFFNLEELIQWLTKLKSSHYRAINQGAIDSAISKAIVDLNQQKSNI